MRLALFLCVLLALPSVSAGNPSRSRMRVRARAAGSPSSQPSGVLDWSRSWQDLSLSMPSGIPEPTISCVAAASGGELSCTNNGAPLTATKVGSPTTVEVGGYPARTAAVTGISDYFNLGDVGDVGASGSMSVALVFERNALASYPLSKYTGTGGDSSYTVYDGGAGSFFFRVCSAPGVCSGSNSHAIAADALVVCVGAYSYSGTPGASSTLNFNCNGVEAVSVTNATGPIANSVTDLKIGSAAAASIVAAYVWNNVSLTSTERAALVASQQARLASKPLGALVTVTSGATKAWGADGVVYSLPAGSLAPSPTGAGMEIWSAAQHSNALPTSTTAGWTPNPATANDVGVNTDDTVANAPGPDGSATSATTLTAGVGGYVHKATQTYTATAVPWVDSLYFKVEAGKWALISPDSGTGLAYVDLGTCAIGTTGGSVTATAELMPGGLWCRASMVKTLTAAVKTFVIYIAAGDNNPGFTGTGTETLTFYAPQAQIGTVAGPPTPSAGTPIVGAADVPSVATTVTKDKFCAGIRYTCPEAWATAYPLGFGNYGSVDSFAMIYGTPKVKAYQWYSGGFRTWITDDAMSFSSGSTHELAWCYMGGDGSIYVDGVQKPITISDTGTFAPIGTLPTTLSIAPVVGGVALNASVECVCQSKDWSGLRKCFQRCP